MEQKVFSLKLTSQPGPLTFIFAIQDEISAQDQARDKTPRLEQFADTNGWQALTPVLASKDNRLSLHIPFIKIDPNTAKPVRPKLPSIQVPQTPKAVQEITIGADINIDNFAVISVMETNSIYTQEHPDNPNSLVRTLDRPTRSDQYGAWIRQTELARYIIDDVEALDVQFDSTTGQFKNLEQVQDQPVIKYRGIYNQRKNRRGKWKKRPSTDRRGKGKLRLLFAQIRQTQAQMNTRLRKSPEADKTDREYLDLAAYLSRLWTAYHRILETIAQAVAAKMRDVAVYFQSRYPDYVVRVQVEDLRWTQFSAKDQSGYYLAHNQVQFFHSQIQQALGLLLREQGIGLWRVKATYTSKRCALCGYLPPTQAQRKKARQGRTYICQNRHHRIRGQAYTTHADVNAARNIALAAPISKEPIN